MRLSAGLIAANDRALAAGPPTSAVAARLTEAIQRGKFSTAELNAYATWMVRHHGEDGRHDYELLGGETGQRWLDEVNTVKAAALPVVEEPEPEAIIAGAIDYLNVKEQSAFIRIWTVLELAAKNAYRRSLAKATSSIRNEDIRVKMAAADNPFAEVPEKVWAKLDGATSHIITSSVDDAMDEVIEVFRQEATLVPRMVEVIGMPVTPEILEAQERALSNAAKYLTNELPEQIRRRVRPDAEEPSMVLPPAVVRHAMLLAGGADPEEPTDSGFPVRQGRLMAAGFGMLNGPLFFEALRGAPVKTAALNFPSDQLKIAYKWRHAYFRDPIKPFEPHKRLNGRVFLLENWENLQSRNKPDDEFPWVDPVTNEQIDGYFVGDHEHCTCAILPRFEHSGASLGTEWFDARLAGELFEIEPKVAAYNPLQPRCPRGTGVTAGRFSNEYLVNCNPIVTQLTDRALELRVKELEAELAEGPDRDRAARLEDELAIAQAEVERREAGGEAGAVADDPSEVTDAEPEYVRTTAEGLTELAAEQGGFTVRGGHEPPTEGYGVADPEHTLAIEGWEDLDASIRDAVIEKYLDDNEAQFIADPDIFLGAWIDEEGVMFLDLTKVVSDRNEAVTLGTERGEQAIFGFDGFETIPTGGTGNEQRITTAEAFLSPSSGGDGGGNGETSASGNGAAGSALDVRELRAGAVLLAEHVKSLRRHGWTPEDPFPLQEIEDQIQALGKGVHQGAVERAPMLKDEMLRVADLSNAEMSGLEHQVKGTDSLMRKLRDRFVTREMPLTDAAAAAAIKDANRFTFVIPDSQYSLGVRAGIQALEAGGFELVEMDNTWEQGDAYSGINAIWRDPSGSQVEVQWHTPASIAVKKRIHKAYELFRTTNDVAYQRRLFFEMASEWDSAPAPTGWPPINLDTFDGRATLIWRGPPELSRTAALVTEPLSGNPYHCPAGTGETAGRFTDAMGGTCNPTVELLSATGLDQRKARLEMVLQGEISTERRARLEEEVRLVDAEQERRDNGGEIGDRLDVQSVMTAEPPVPIPGYSVGVPWVDRDMVAENLQMIETPFGPLPDHRSLADWAEERLEASRLLIRGIAPDGSRVLDPSEQEIEAIIGRYPTIFTGSDFGVQFGTPAEEAKGIVQWLEREREAGRLPDGWSSWPKLTAYLSNYLAKADLVELEEAGLLPVGSVKPPPGFSHELALYQIQLEEFMEEWATHIPDESPGEMSRREYDSAQTLIHAAQEIPPSLLDPKLLTAFSDAAVEHYVGQFQVVPIEIGLPSADDIQLRAADENFKMGKVHPKGVHKGALKNLVVTQISEHTGVSYDEVNSMVAGWAHSAQFQDAGRMQAVADEALGGDGVFTQVTRKALFDPQTYDANDVPESYDKVLESMYQHTQALLQEEGIEEVGLMRGAKFGLHNMPDSVREVVANLSEEEYQQGSTFAEVEWDRNPITSWSTSRREAANFAMVDNSQQISVKQEVVAPAAAVLCTPQTGFGCLGEEEVLLLDAGGPARVEFRWNPRVTDQSYWSPDEPKPSSRYSDHPLAQKSQEATDIAIELLDEGTYQTFEEAVMAVLEEMEEESG